MTRIRLLLATGGLIVVLGAALLVPRLLASAGRATTGDDSSGVPTTTVGRGSIDLSVFGLGELRASKSAALSAPSIGGNLRLLRLLDAGAPVKKGDVVMEFDPSEQQFALEQAKSQLDEAAQQALKTHADLDAETAQDDLDLLTARFDVRRAELDAAPDKELVPANTYEKNQIALDEARRRLAQLEADAAARKQTSQASVALADVAKAKAELGVTRAKQNLDNLIVTAPIDGIVSLRENRDASGIFFSGMSMPDYRAGDNVLPGRPVADVVDFSGLQIHIRVSEQQRTNVAVGQHARVSIDSLPGVAFPATIQAIAGLATGNQDTGGPLRQFDTTLVLDQPDDRLRPGATASVVIAGRTVEGVFVLPLQAVQQKDGKAMVYEKVGDRFEARDVRVSYRSESQAAIEGLAPGAVVALVDPTHAQASSAASTAPAAGGST